MKKKKINKSLKRSKNRTVRGTPFFDEPIKHEKTDLVMEPETFMDVARLLADEIKKKWPDGELPEKISGKHIRLANEISKEFAGDTIISIIRILVWDFEEIKKNKAFFPPCSHLSWPWIDQLHHFRLALASATQSGITDSTSRVSAYAQKYLGQKPQETSSIQESSGNSMQDLARKILGDM